MDESDKPALSQDTLRALNEFLSEAKAAADEQQNPFSENWGLSQVASFVLANLHWHRTVQPTCIQALKESYMQFFGQSLPSASFWSLSELWRWLSSHCACKCAHIFDSFLHYSALAIDSGSAVLVHRGDSRDPGERGGGSSGAQRAHSMYSMPLAVSSTAGEVPGCQSTSL